MKLTKKQEDVVFEIFNESGWMPATSLRKLPEKVQGDLNALLPEEKGLVSLDAVEKAIRKAISGSNQLYVDGVVEETLRLLAPKPETLEERVTVEKWVWDTDRWIVLDRGWNMSNTGGFKDKKDAEIFRLGWIEKCRKEEAK
jgi:hypothetical protein